MKKILLIFAFAFFTIQQVHSQLSPSVGDYGSIATGNWSSASTWGIWDGAAFVGPAASAPTGTEKIFLQHNITLDQNVVISGYLKNNVPATLITTATTTNASANISVTGSTTGIAIGQRVYGSGINSTATVSSITGGSPYVVVLSGNSTASASTPISFAPLPISITMGSFTLTIASTGTYEHGAEGGTIPICIWQPGATCLVTGIAAATSVTGLNSVNTLQYFQNLTINCPNLVSNNNFTLNIGNAPSNVNGTVIAGNFRCVSTGATPSQLRLWSMTSGVTKSVSIGGDFILEGGIVTSTGSGGPFTAANTNFNLAIAGNLNISGGSLFMVASSSPAITDIWTLNGNLNMTGGLLTINNSNPASTFMFAKAGTQTFTRTGTTTLNGVPFFVNTGTTLSLGTSVIDGGSHIVLNTGATLQTANATGVAGAVATTGNRAFDEGANYIFDGSSAQNINAFSNNFYIRGGAANTSTTVGLALYNSAVAVGQTITGTGIPASTTISAISAPISLSKTSGGATSSSTTLTVTDATGIVPGLAISTTAGVRLGLITAVSGTTLTLSSSATVSASTALTISGQTLTISNATTAAGANFYTIALPNVATANNLTISNSAGVSLNTPLGITGKLAFGNVNNAAFTSTGNLTLKSSSTGTAKVADITNGGVNTGNAISGNVVVERYIPSGQRAFRFLSHPFSGNLGLSSLTDNIDITGDGGTSPMTTTGSNNPSAFGYDNTSADASLSYDPGWTALTSTSTLDAKKGYRILVRGAKGEGLNGSVYTPSAVTLNWTGALNTGDQIVTLANNGTNRDYTLIGNPYASPVDLSLVTRGSNVNANFYVWNATTAPGVYQTLPFSSSYILPSGAAFFAQSAGNTNNTITFTEASKSTGTPVNILRTTQADDKLILEVRDSKNNYADQLSFYFNDKTYTANNDVLWDAAKMNNPDVNFYSFSADAKKLAIDRRPTPNQNIALGFTAKTLGNYTIVVNELPNRGTYYLRDNYLQTETALEANTNIVITVTTEAASQGANRFELVMKASPVVLPSSTLEVKMSPNPVKDVLTVSYSNPTEAVATVRIINSKGQVLQTQSLGNTAAGNQAINMAKYGKGIYTVELTIGKERISKQVVKN